MRFRDLASASALRIVVLRSLSSLRCRSIAVLYAVLSDPTVSAEDDESFEKSTCDPSSDTTRYLPSSQYSFGSLRQIPACRIRSRLPNAYAPVSPYWYVRWTLNGSPSSGCVRWCHCTK